MLGLNTILILSLFNDFLTLFLLSSVISNASIIFYDGRERGFLV